MTKRILWSAFKYGLGMVLLAYVVWRNWSAPPDSGGIGLADALQRPVQFVPLLLATLICSVAVLLTLLRWYVLVRAQELPFTLGNAIRLGLIGYYLSTFLPGSIGGDLVKAAFIAREQKRRTVAISTVLVDRVAGLWALVWLVALLGSVFWAMGNPSLERHQVLQTILLSCLAIVAGSVVFWLLMGLLSNDTAHTLAGRLARIPKLGPPLAEFWRAMWMYRRKGGSIALAMILGLVGHVGFVLTFYFAAQIFLLPEESGQIPSLAEHFLIVPVGMTWQAFFPSPGGVGGGELGYGKLYDMVGKPRPYGVLGSLSQRVIMAALALVGYIIYLRMRPALREITEKKSTPIEALALELGSEEGTGAQEAITTRTSSSP